MPKRRKTYSGALAQPIPHIPFPGYPLSLLAERDPAVMKAKREAALHDWAAQGANVLMEKMSALFGHYGIPEGDYLRLAYELANAHVPGFSMAKAPAGAPARWTAFDVAALRFHLDELKRRHPRLSMNAAADRAARSGIWDAKTRSAPTGPTLLRRAANADPVWVKFFSDAYHYETEIESPPSVQSVEEFVRKWVSPDFRIGGNAAPSIPA